MAKLAVFDCDGTLVDGQASICDAMDKAFAGVGLALPEPNLVRRIVGLSLPQAIRQLLPDAEETLRREITEGYKLAYRAAREAGELSEPLYDGIFALLNSLRQGGWQLGVATGKSDRGLIHCLASHGLSDHFCTLQTADRHPSKPHPAMLEAALAEALAEPREAVMIGDTAYDMAMAQAAGVVGIGVDWGYHTPVELMRAGAELVVGSPAELAEFLRS
jgi:phosphoglycolate phosphatase